MSSICLAGGGIVVKLAAAITLSWTQAVEKVRWEEDWRAHPAGIAIIDSRIQGKPQRYRPHLAPQKQVVIRRSGATTDWTICQNGICKPMSELLPANADPVTMSLCD